MSKSVWVKPKEPKLALARAYVRKYAPYLSPTLYGMVPVAQPGLTDLVGGPLAVTDRLVLLYEPEWVDSEEATVMILATGLAHECLHDQLKHVSRGKRYPDQERWNIAADLFINGSMKTQKKKVNRDKKTVEELMWEFPDWAVMPEQYGFPVGKTADEYYKLLENEAKKQPAKIPGAGLGAAGSGSNGKGSGKKKILCGGCGGVAGNPTSRELEGKHNSTRGRSESDCKAIARETSKQIQKHLESQQGRGSMPGIWAELVDMSEDVFEVPWREKVANIARYSIGRIRTGGMDYSKRRPSKRSYLRGITLPSLVAYDPVVFFIIDSSGSMGHKQLADALRVCADVLQQTGISEAWLVEADTEQKRDPILVKASDLHSFEVKGRGGTSFIPATEFVDKEFKPRPNLVIYLTDGDGEAPAAPPPNMLFIWCIVPSGWSRQAAPWGETIMLTDHLEGRKEEDDEDAFLLDTTRLKNFA